MRIEDKSYQSVQSDESQDHYHQQVDKNKQDLFERELKNDKDDEMEQKQSSQSDLSSIFSSLMGNKLQDSAQTIAATNTTLANDTNLDNLVDDLIAKILVSDPNTSAGNEIRLFLSEKSFLNGTEIILRRGLEGLLAVEINCKNKDQYKKLNEAKDLLIEALESHESQRVLFSLNVQNNDESSNATEHFNENNYKL